MDLGEAKNGSRVEMCGGQVVWSGTEFQTRSGNMGVRTQVITEAII